MFEVGEIVCHKNSMFNDNNYDKKVNRPCIVLFSINRGDRNLICTAPLTSSIDSFNRNPSRYFFVPEVIYNYKKLNFVSLENISLHSDVNTFSINIHIEKEEVKGILNRFKNHIPRTENLKNMYEEIINYINYIELFEKLDERENALESRKIKKLKRKNAKRGINA